MTIIGAKKNSRIRRHKRIRAKIIGNKERPRLSVFKSNRYLYAQIIDDEKQVTLVSATTKGKKETSTIKSAKDLGKEIATLAKANKI